MPSDLDTAAIPPDEGVPDDDATTIVVRQRPDQTELLPGAVLRDRFVIERLLGSGGMGQVFLAIDREAEKTNPYVALKMLGDGFKQHPQSLKALRREASQTQRMNHPNIVNVFYFERTTEHVFMVMEYMQGEALDDYIQAKPNGAKFSAIWPIVDGMCQGLIYLHKQKVIHSDFKPSNVFVTEEGEVKVLDLGIARTLDEVNAAEGTTRFDPDALGALTPSYASSEMFQGMTPNEQDDLYALGCVTYELLTGRHPFDRKTAIEARAASLEPARPSGLKGRQWRALKSALGLTRAERPEHVIDFLREITPEQAPSSKTAWIASAVAVVVALGVGSFVYLSGENSDDRYLRSTLDKYPPGNNLVETEVAQLWLEQGVFFLELGNTSLQKGAYEQATIQLLTAPSSAMQSYKLVLSRSDDEASRNIAAQGMLSIANAYKDVAMGLVGNQDAQPALAKTTCIGLDVNQFDAELLEIYEGLTQSAPGTLGELMECRRLISSGKIMQ